MQVTFLGTSSGVPTRARNVSSMALKLPQSPDLWLFDCGEGTQHQFLKSNLRLSQLKKIFISHMHGDHVFGLPGLLASLGLSGNSLGLDLYGPEPLERFIRESLKNSYSRISYPIRFHRVEDKATRKSVLCDEQRFVVNCTKINHRVPCFAYRVDEKEKPGRFNLELAQKLQIPPGPNYARLQRGEIIELEDGRKFNGQDFCGSPRAGVSMVYCTDTVFCESAVELATGADLLIHESTYAHKDSEMAYERTHSTSTMAAQVALEAKAGRLVLTHLSPRYAPGQNLSPENLLKEARSIFPNTILAKDFLQIDIKKSFNS